VGTSTVFNKPGKKCTALSALNSVIGSPSIIFSGSVDSALNNGSDFFFWAYQTPSSSQVPWTNDTSFNGIVGLGDALAVTRSPRPGDRPRLGGQRVHVIAGRLGRAAWKTKNRCLDRHTARRRSRLNPLLSLGENRRVTESNSPVPAHLTIMFQASPPANTTARAGPLSATLPSLTARLAISIALSRKVHLRYRENRTRGDGRQSSLFCSCIVWECIPTGIASYGLFGKAPTRASILRSARILG